MSGPLPELLGLMERLRASDGCPWDRAQTFASIAPYTIEEAYEVADAIERGSMRDLKDELGDLLFQVVFLAQLAREAGHFDFDAVARSIHDKLVRRHPHVFNGAAPDAEPLSIERQTATWEDIKARERAAVAAAALSASGAEDPAPHTREAADSLSAVDGVPLALPALMRAVKLSRRAARVGFDFKHAAETADKVAEELAEVREAAAADAAAAHVGATDVAATDTGGTQPSRLGNHRGPSRETVEEVGDLLFAAANLARKLNVDAEAALRAANAKFERRFRAMERLAAQRGLSFDALGLVAQEALWQEVKRGE
jgi:MazG family protein